MSRSILAVPGLSKTSPAFRAALWDMAAAEGFDVDAIATVMSRESGFNPSIRNPDPKSTATGLIQFTEPTAKSLGTSTAALARMSGIEQLPYVAAFYRRARLTSSSRPWDYYVAGLGQPQGLPLDRQVVPDKHYAKNASLDHDGDGRITVADVRAVFSAVQARAAGRRLDASPFSVLASTQAESVPVPDGLLWESASRSQLPAVVGDLRAARARAPGGPKADPCER